MRSGWNALDCHVAALLAMTRGGGLSRRQAPNRQPTLPTTVKRLPSPPPLAGEGARRAGEGFVPNGAQRR
jgi:hypothetical protein